VRIGIVIPAHDAAPWIADAIGSVLAQSHADWSAVIVDDGSTDDTAPIASRFLRDARVALIRQERAGVSAARNRGMAACDGAEALLFLDADDWLARDALARLAFALAAAPGAVAACGPAAFVLGDRRTGPSLRCQQGDILPRLLERNLFANGGHVLIDAAAARGLGGFRADLSYGEDWEFLIRLAACGAFAPASGAPVLFVRRRAEGAYHGMAGDPASFAPCMEAIFANPALQARFGPVCLGAIRARAEAENLWVIGRALFARDRARARACLRRSLKAKPSLKRLLLTAAAHLPR
jgi:glycosyltransferase involved in cell wall biosynthesis